MREEAMPWHRRVLSGVLVALIGILFESWAFIALGVFGIVLALVPGNDWLTFEVGADDGD